MQSNDNLFWADKIAIDVKDKVERDETLKKVVKEKGYICYDEKTPSGRIHIGSGRGWVIHDAVTKALRDLGLKARFILSSDDIDPFDKIPSGLNKEKFKQYLGIPLRDIPSPVKGYESYAQYYFNECIEKFEEFGIEAEIESTGKRYDDGTFNTAIEIVLNNANKINNIYKKFYGKDLGRLPFNPICERCGKIATTVAYEWDPDKKILKYRCTDLVEFAKGCGYEDEISPFNGNGKFPWKVEWAAKWFSIGVVFETAGKDHFTKGGSRSVAVAISDEVFDFPPPYPSTRKSIGYGYEFFIVEGKKMSTSKGVGVSFKEIADLISPKILRYLLIRTRPRAVIDFNPFGTNRLLLLYQNYDRTERIYFGVEQVNEREKKHESRIYELSQVGKIPKRMPPQISFGFASILIQTTNFNVERAIEKLKSIKKIPKELTKDEIKYLKERFIDAANWIKRFAPEQYKFTFKSVDETKKLLNEMQKKALKEIAKILDKKLNEEELEGEIYKVAKKYNVREVFKAAYLALIGKDRGPRLVPFIMCIGIDETSKRFKEV